MPTRVNQRKSLADENGDGVPETVGGTGIGLRDGEKLYLGKDNNWSVRRDGDQLIWRDEINDIDIPLLKAGNGNVVATFDVEGGEPVYFGDDDEIALQFDQENSQFTIIDTENNETRLIVPLAGALKLGGRAMDLDGQDIQDEGTVIYDSANAALQNIDKLLGADFANASSGEVPKAQGDGTLAMGSVGGGEEALAYDFVMEGM